MKLCQCNHCRSRRERRVYALVAVLFCAALTVPLWPLWEAAMKPIIRGIRAVAISQG